MEGVEWVVKKFLFVYLLFYQEKAVKLVDGRTSSRFRDEKTERMSQKRRGSGLLKKKNEQQVEGKRTQKKEKS